MRWMPHTSERALTFLDQAARRVRQGPVGTQLLLRLARRHRHGRSDNQRRRAGLRAATIIGAGAPRLSQLKNGVPEPTICSYFAREPSRMYVREPVSTRVWGQPATALMIAAWLILMQAILFETSRRKACSSRVPAPPFTAFRVVQRPARCRRHYGIFLARTR